MKKYDFNHGWTCRALSDGSVPCPVTLPHDAMISEERTEDSPGAENIGWFSCRDYEYVKTFSVPEEYRDKTVLFEFEGIYHRAEVFLNGRSAACRPYGYTNFYVRTEGLLRYGENNEIRVTAHNQDQPNSRWYPGTGIYRPVWMYVGERKHIPVNGVKIRTLNHSPAVVEVQVCTSAPGTVRAEILDKDRVILSAEKESEDGRAVFMFPVPDAVLWSCETPYLYTCRAVFENDEVTEQFGIRTLNWDTERGLTVNGERVILRGACIHHDNGILGACAFPEAEERKVRILKDAGYNALRSAHNPCSKAILDACDRLGMLMMDEYVDVWYIHKTKYDYAQTVMDWWKQDLKDMVDKDYNHPSVIMYSTGNEVAETSEKRGIEFTGQMTEYLHQLDPARPVTCGINIFFNFLYSIGLGVYSDDKAEKGAQPEAGQKKGTGKASEKKKPVGSEFYNTLACLVGDYFMKIGATLPPCDWKTRDAFANMDIAGYNYGLFRYKHDLKKYPKRLILGSETFCKDAYSFWEIAKKNPRIIGDFVWAGMDYIGEIGEGAAEYSDYKYAGPATSMTGGNGRVDLLGKPRAEAAYTRVSFEQASGPFIAVKPPYQEETLRLTGWQLTKAIESWSWRGSGGKQTEAEVYARGATVELFVNGKSAGRKKLKKCRAVFKLPYQDGEVTAVSYDGAGKKISEQTLYTAGETTRLSVIPEQESVRPGGLAFIRIQYTDDAGIWKPMEKHTVRVSVQNGTLLGLGTACPYVEGGYCQDTVRTYYGEAMAVVRSDGTGPVTVIVSDGQLENTVTVSEFIR